MTDGHKKSMDLKAKKERMAAKKATWEQNTFTDDLACPLHGFVSLNCKSCISRLKQRLSHASTPAAPPQE